MTASPWRRSLAYGPLWAVTITAGEALGLPFGALSGAEHAAALGAIFVSWLPAGVAMALLAFTAEQRRLPIGRTALLLVPLAVATSVVSSATYTLYSSPPLERVLGQPPPSWGSFGYVVWMTLFHGALFTTGCMLAMRAERTRALLGDAQIARGKTEALLVDAEFDALRARIDPAFLLRVMGEVQQRYADDAPAADRLLDQLVAFLRHAMPGVRGGASTLAVELRLAQTYAALCEQIDPLRSPWRFVLDEPPADVAFPPLLLLPLLDRLAPRNGMGPSGELRLRVRPGELRLSIHGTGAPASLPSAWVYRLKVALRASFGDTCSLWINSTALRDAPAVVLRVTPAGQARRALLTLVPKAIHDQEVRHG